MGGNGDCLRIVRTDDRRVRPQAVRHGATIMKPLAATAWGTKDFYIEDPDGYIISFGGSPSAERIGTTQGLKVTFLDRFTIGC